MFVEQTDQKYTTLGDRLFIAKATRENVLRAVRNSTLLCPNTYNSIRTRIRPASLDCFPVKV